MMTFSMHQSYESEVIADLIKVLCAALIAYLLVWKPKVYNLLFAKYKSFNNEAEDVNNVWGTINNTGEFIKKLIFFKALIRNLSKKKVYFLKLNTTKIPQKFTSRLFNRIHFNGFAKKIAFMYYNDLFINADVILLKVAE